MNKLLIAAILILIPFLIITFPHVEHIEKAKGNKYYFESGNWAEVYTDKSNHQKYKKYDKDNSFLFEGDFKDGKFIQRYGKLQDNWHFIFAAEIALLALYLYFYFNKDYKNIMERFKKK